MYSYIIVNNQAKSVMTEIVYISEVVSKNTSLQNSNGHTPDIIKLYNSGSEDVSLSGWDIYFLGTSYYFPDISILAGEYHILFCRPHSWDAYMLEFSMGFNIPSTRTSTILLFDDYGYLVDSVSVPPLGENMAWARNIDSRNEWSEIEMKVDNPKNHKIESLINYENFWLEKAGLDEYENHVIILLTVNPDDLYDDTTGIFANYMDKKQERRALFEYINKDRMKTITQDVGIRVRGLSTRGLNPKSLTIKAREGYGKQYLIEPFFSDREKYRTIILRHRNPVYLDGFLQSLVANRNLSTQNQKLAIVFLNGEFYGEFALMEKYDADYFAFHYNVEPDNVFAIQSFIDNNYHFEIEAGKNEDRYLFEDLLDLLLNRDLSNKKNYEALKNMVDIQSLIDYYCANIYLGNLDAKAFHMNSIAWRVIVPENTEYGDGKWRFAMYDMDAALFDYSFNLFTSCHNSLHHSALTNIFKI